MTMRTPSPGALLDDLRNTCFSPAGGPAAGVARVGMEVEAIVVDADTRRPFPLEPGLSPRATLQVLRGLAPLHGWLVRQAPDGGAPDICLPDGARITFEPGGQMEYSSAPQRSASAVLRAAREVFALIGNSLEPAGAELLFAGIDPINAVDDAPLQLRSERYLRMDRHFRRIGSHGARMMRQTASLQFTFDWGEELERGRRWTLANALAPYLAAIFANSPCYGGKPTGHRSFRRVVWDTLDPLRTGMRDTGDGAEAAYLQFALGAPAILMPGGDRPCAPFAQWLETGCVAMSDWHAHLSTLFPEVRPRGYLEVRTADSLPPEWFAAPMVLLLGLLYDRQSSGDACALLGEPDPSLLERAGRDGVSDVQMGNVARDLWAIALRGCARLGEHIVSPEDVEVASEFAARFTAGGLTPADETLARVSGPFAMAHA